MPEYSVTQGDSLSSIAFAHGLHWEVVWNHSHNAELRRKRKDPNVIYPGDVVFVPEKELRVETRSTEARHKFVRLGVHDEFQVRLLKDFKPRANEPYTLVVDGKTVKGKTDGDGWLRESISPAARVGELLLDGGKEKYELALGHIDPIDTISGLQGRLYNLGFLGAEVTGEMDDDTGEAVRRFQAANGITITGEPDDATLHKVKTEYGC